MRSFTILSIVASTFLLQLTSAAPTQAEPGLGKRAQPEGVDVASYQGNVDWAALKAAGITFANVKATQSTDYKNPFFDQQYTGSYNAGMIHGAYHFAIPNGPSGADQANFFVENGGAWSADGKTLPGTIDLEDYQGQPACYGLSESAMVAWIRDFSNTYHAKTSRYPTIYTNRDWWTRCTGNDSSFGSTNALWVASWNPTVGELPAGWSVWSFWQYTSTGEIVGDHDRWNGDDASLTRFATGN